MKGRIFYLSEFFRFFQKRIQAILFVAFIGSLTGFFLALVFERPHFRAEATFRHIPPSQYSDKDSLQSVFNAIWQKSDEAYATSVMQSKTILKKVIEENGLQIKEKHTQHILPLLLRELRIPLKEKPFLFRNVSYDKDGIEPFFIKPIAENRYEVLDKKKRRIASGHIGLPLALEWGSWTLVHMPEKKSLAAFTIFPVREVLPTLKKQFTIKKSKQDACLLELKVKHRNRSTATALLNGIMKHFQSYLQEMHRKIAREQLHYLKQRRSDLSHDLEQTLLEHATYLQNTLGIEGFLGFSQELELLNDPKERYTTQKHQIDLEMKKWRHALPLEARVQHPWQEGIKKKDMLDWQALQIEPQSFPTEEISKINLETTQKLHMQYGEKYDQLLFQAKQLQDFQEKLMEADFELSSLSEILQDPIDIPIIQKSAEIHLQLADTENRTEKEKLKLQSALLTQKKFLSEHLENKRKILQLQIEQMLQKMLTLEQHALCLLQKEKENVEYKLAEINKNMANLPEKWRLESRLKLKKELTMQILEGITKLSESKIIDHHLFHIESNPLDIADAPMHIHPPHLMLYASVGGLLGGFAFAMLLLIRAFSKGFPISKEYLLDRNFQVATKELAMQTIVLELSHGQILALIGCHWVEEIVTTLKREGKKVLMTKNFLLEEKSQDHILILECHAPADSPVALWALAHCDYFLLQLKEEKEIPLTPYEGKKGLFILEE